MKRIIILAAAVALAGCSQKAEEPAILPRPVEINMHKGSVVLKSEADITYAVDEACGLPAEGYILNINKKGVSITAPDEAGLLFGQQTLRQLLPVEAYTLDGQLVSVKGASLPCLEIRDWPRLGWRGLHLDVSRHFFTAEQVKKFIDVMSMYKFNRFHWHLVDDQGWRIEIKSHPELTEKGAWREGKGFVDNQRLGFNVEDGQPYGGFYTQDDIRDVVAYAASKGITVVPEIDLPGHSTAAIHSIPEIFCFPSKKMEVRMEGGVSEGVLCAGKEITFSVLEDVLAEVIDLFPSEYIHLGGDEAPKAGWKKCPDCQARIKAEGLADENELQSYFMKRLEKFLNSKGRKMIGWDEIMEGGLSATATVMSWRGVQPGMEAAEIGNDVIMTPGSYVYLSQPQSVNPVTQATGDVTSLRTVYSFNPVPDQLDAEAAKHIIGIQGCQWTEHTPNEMVLYYKEYPRAIAIAEIGWTPQEDRSWDCFYERIQKHLPRLEYYGIGYGAPSYDVKIAVVPDANGNPQAQFTIEVPCDIHYTIDGSEPDADSPVAHGAIPLTESCTVKACMYRPDGSKGRVAQQEVIFHKALCKPVAYNLPYSMKHTGGGDFAMTDGSLGKWQGFEKQDVDFTIDLGSVQEISRIDSNWKYDIMDWVLRPLDVTYLVSADGVEFTEIHRETFENTPGDFSIGVLDVEYSGTPLNIRYIQVKATNQKINPKWHSSAGAACWIFIDEVVVE